jgi:uncharacterized cupredoxin-like copper-binding protein
MGPAVVLIGAGQVQAGAYGHLVQMDLLAFHPDTLATPGDSFSVLVVQNREDGPIQHEVTSRDLFDPAVLISVLGTGHIEYEAGKVSRVLLDPGEEAVIWFYAVKGHEYIFECNINGHAMRGSIRGE